MKVKVKVKTKMSTANYNLTYQWVCFPAHKAIRHAIGSELNPTEEEQKELDAYPSDMASMARLSAAIGRKEVVGDYDSNENMGHAKWKAHYMGAAAEDIAKIIAAVPDWGSGITCDIGFAVSSADSLRCNFITPAPSVVGVTADDVRKLITLTHDRLPTSSHPDMIIMECAFNSC